MSIARRMSTAHNVAIFGIGPSGLAAAQAVLRSGGNVTLVSKTREPSPLFGCQYLHAPIPGYEDVPTATVSYSLSGSPEDYRRKVYGHSWDGKVSPEDFLGEHQAWDIRETYRRLWDVLVAKRRDWQTVRFVEAEVTPNWLGEHEYLLKGFDAVISTIPATHLCNELSGHRFLSHLVFAQGNTEEKYTLFPPDNSIRCDGTEGHPWYRMARVFGYTTTEWAYRPHRSASVVEKPLSTDCDCFPYIQRMGRYGAWEKGRLVHEVYAQAEKLMENLYGIPLPR